MLVMHQAPVGLQVGHHAATGKPGHLWTKFKKRQTIQAMNKGQFRKGDKRPGAGRPKGLANKTTIAAREAISRFVDGNADRLQGWLDQIAEEQGPSAAFKCFSDLLEYHVPKLARTEVTGADGGPQELVVRWADER